MLQIKEDVVRFFQEQGFVIISTIDKSGSLHSACKGIVDINSEGKIHLLDLYRGTTLDNLKNDPNISITAVNEHKFKGYCLKGKASVVKIDEVSSELMANWEAKINSRVSQRIIKNIQGEKGHPLHPEILLPRPEYMIAVEIHSVIDLTPHKLKQEK
jgi:hypothetical protein